MTHRFFLTAALFFSIVFTAQAQWSAGISGGANLSFWYWKINSLNHEIDFGPGVAWRAAIPVELQLSPSFGIRTELANQVFSNSRRMIWTFPGQQPFDNRTGRIRENYNSIGGSLLAKFSPLKKHRNTYLLAGPSLAYITHGWFWYSKGLAEGRDKAWRERFDLENNKVQRYQWKADLGLGYTFSIGAKNSIAVELRYQHGLNSFSESSNVTTSMQTALLNVGYMRNL